MQELDPVQRRRDADDQFTVAAPGHGSLATSTVCEAGRSGQNAPSTSVLEVSDDGRHGDENVGRLFADDSHLATEGLLSARDARNEHVETDPPSSSVTGNRELVSGGLSSNVGPPTGDVILDGSAIDNAELVEVVPPISSIREPLVSSAAEPPVAGIAEPVGGTAEAPVVGTTEAPVVGTAEAPVVGTSEAPVVGTAEAPVVGTAEAPVVGTAEAPVVGTAEVSVVGTAEVPNVGTTEAPVVGTAEAPVAGTAEAPVEGTAELLVVELPEPQGEPHLVQENVTVVLLPLNDSIDEFQQEPAAPVEKSNHKKRHAEATQESNDYDSVICPICMEAWTNSGDHQICSLACGHLFGSSCIKRWLQQAGRKYGKCPHCNKRAKLEDVRTLYVPHVAVVDGESQQLVQEVRGLRAQNHHLKLENAKLLKEVQQHKERNALILQQTFTSGSINYDTVEVDTLSITTGSEPIPDPRKRAVVSRFWHSAFRQDCNLRNQSNTGHGQVLGAGDSSNFARTESLGDSFVFKTQVPVHGGKVFDMDGDGQTVLFSNKIQGYGSRFGLSKMSLLACTEIEKIDLPLDFGAIFDIRLSSGFGGPGKLALVASAGKKLSVMSLESNNIVLTYSVQSAPWSCAWDPCFPNLLYSGLQNGSLLMLDLRQTSSPVAVLSGPSDRPRPIHTLHVIPDCSTMQTNMGHQSGSREILSASNNGIFRWNLGSSAATDKTIRPQCVCSVKDKVCISLAYEGSIDTAVGSFRRSPLVQNEASTSGSSAGQSSSQPLDAPEMCQPPPDAINLGDPCHWVFNRGLENSGSRASERSSPGNAELHWQWAGGMGGHKSQSSLLTRGAIISKWESTLGSKSLFAGGDEGTNRVWLWDMESFKVIDTLEPPHQSPVLDIKNVQIQGRDLMGSVSGSNFHLYQRCSTAD